MASVEDLSDDVMLEASLQFKRNYCSSDEDGKESCDDGILLQASLQYEHDLEQEDSRFVMCTDEEIERSVCDSVPKTTKKQTNWCMRVWHDWRAHRIKFAKSDADVPPELLKMSPDELCTWISRFIYEVRKQDKSPYIGETLYQLICGIQRHLRGNSFPDVDFFK